MSRPLVWTFRSRITFVRAITQINQEEKTTILLATHDLSDIEQLQLCDRIFMIDKGQEIFVGTVSQLKETFGKMKTLSL